MLVAPFVQNVLSVHRIAYNRFSYEVFECDMAEIENGQKDNAGGVI